MPSAPLAVFASYQANVDVEPVRCLVGPTLPDACGLILPLLAVILAGRDLPVNPVPKDFRFFRVKSNREGSLLR